MRELVAGSLALATEKRDGEIVVVKAMILKTVHLQSIIIYPPRMC